MRLSPTIIAIQANLARALWLDGQYREASEIYADLVKRFPENPTFLCNLGVSLFQENRIPESVKCFERALRINPDLQDAKINLEAARKRLLEN
jgi:tetratricopeptide (TPR) repeat protein